VPFQRPINNSSNGRKRLTRCTNPDVAVSFPRSAISGLEEDSSKVSGWCLRIE
jgi:hypothetical protein